MVVNSVRVPFLQCQVELQRLSSANATISTSVLPNCRVLLARNSFRDLVLNIVSSKSGKHGGELSYPICDITVCKRFASSGKASLRLPSHNTLILLSNCAPQTLINFLRSLMVKVNKTQQKGFVLGVRDRLKQGAVCTTLDEVSPLTMQEVRQFANKDSTETPFRPIEKNAVSSENVRTKTPVQKPSINSSSFTLTEEQMKVMRLVQDGQSVFFTGSAGCGKSYLLQRIIRSLPPNSTCVTASTGVAASHIGGVTLHNAFSLQSSGDPPKYMKPTFISSVRKIRVLIIDEISMVGASLFDKLAEFLRKVRNSQQPFGGIQLILTGDFLQLPPIGCKQQCFEAVNWSSSVSECVLLRKIHRQNDEKFIRLLETIRLGRCPQWASDLLISRSNKLTCPSELIPTILTTHRDDVEDINKQRLSSLEGESRIFNAIDKNGDCRVLDSLAPRKLLLKLGAQVMFTRNVAVNRGISNGTRAVVIDFTQSGIPRVKLLSGEIVDVEWARYSINAGFDGNIAVRRQLPLTLAWALSIHKSQGMTLDLVEVSMSRVFECGQAYVALSRARSLSGLRVLDLNIAAIRANSTALEFYSQISS